MQACLIQCETSTQATALTILSCLVLSCYHSCHSYRHSLFFTEARLPHMVCRSYPLGTCPMTTHPPPSPCYLCITARSSSSFTSPVTCASEDAQGQLVATGHKDGVLFVWNRAVVVGHTNKLSYSVIYACNAHSEVVLYSFVYLRLCLHQPLSHPNQAVAAVTIARPSPPLPPLIITWDVGGLMVCR